MKMEVAPPREDRMQEILSPEALDYLCQRLAIPPAEAYGVATFYALFSVSPQPPVVAHVCDDLACLSVTRTVN